MTRYMTLAEAQALDCNRCGDCCDSDRADTFSENRYRWRWGTVPDDQYRDFNAGRPLIIPLVTDSDGSSSFRCTQLAFPNGRAACGLRAGGRAIPTTCEDFPVHGGHAEHYASKLIDSEQVVLDKAAGLTRCTWNDVVLIRETADL